MQKSRGSRIILSRATVKVPAPGRDSKGGTYGCGSNRSDPGNCDGNQRQQVRVAQGTDCHAGSGRAQDDDSHPLQFFVRSRQRPADHYRHRSRPQPAHLLRGQGEAGRRVHHSGAQAVRLRQAAARWRHLHQAAGEPLGQHSLRALEYQDGRHGAGELSRAAGIPGVRQGEDSRADPAQHDRPDDLRDFQRRVALHPERRADGVEAGVDHHGGDRRPSPGAHREDRRAVRRDAARTRR